MDSLYGLTYEKLNLSNLPIAYKIQKEEWPDEEAYDDLYDKAINPTDNNCFFLVYDKNEIIAITGVYVYDEYPDSIWLDWFCVLSMHRRKGYGKKILVDVIKYCEKLDKYDYFRLDTTYYDNRPALFLYDKVMHMKEKYTIEDTEYEKNNYLIYTYSFNGKLESWNNRYIGLN